MKEEAVGASSFKRLVTILIAMALCPFAEASVKTPGSTGEQEVLERSIARAEAVGSGVIEYTTCEGPGEPRPSGHRCRRSVAFMGQNWMTRRLDDGFACGTFDGRFLEYFAHPQPNGSRLPLAHVTAPKPIDYYSPPPPIRAGTYWIKQFPGYLKENLQRTRLVEKVTRDGAEQFTFELEVPSKERSRAFHGYTDLTADGAVVGFKVVPAWGYVVPTWEIRNKQGRLFKGFYAQRFQEHQNGIYLPKEFLQRRHVATRTDANHSDFVSYYLDKVELINESIPDRLFQIDLPAGTGVVDARGASEGKPAQLFTVGSVDATDKPPEDFQAALAALPTPQISSFAWFYWLVSGAALALAVFVAVVAFGRQRRAR